VRTFLERTGPAVGICDGAAYSVGRERLEFDDMLFAYTDGVTEARDHGGVLLGRKSLYTVLEHSLLTPASLIESVRDRIMEHSSEQAASDDVTMVALKRI
jgi:sigma-B regulation protein RsbU (phosphoserine phosphatase)